MIGQGTSQATGGSAQDGTRDCCSAERTLSNRTRGHKGTNARDGECHDACQITNTGTAHQTLDQTVIVTVTIRTAAIGRRILTDMLRDDRDRLVTHASCTRVSHGLFCFGAAVKDG